MQNTVKEPLVRYQRMIGMEQFATDPTYEFQIELKEKEGLKRLVDQLQQENQFLKELIKK